MVDRDVIPNDVRLRMFPHTSLCLRLYGVEDASTTYQGTVSTPAAVQGPGRRRNGQTLFPA